MYAYIVTLLLAVGAPAQHHDTVARAIDSATLRAVCGGGWEGLGCQRTWLRSQAELARALVALGRHESRFLARIQAGDCRGKECDAAHYPDGRLVLLNGRPIRRARSYWQIQQTGLVPRREWKQLNGLDYYSTTRAAWAAARIYSRGYRNCKTFRGAFAFYARSRCQWPGARGREKTFHSLATVSK